MNKQQLASKIWEAANKMRSKIEANEYKDYILGFIFYKFLSEKEVESLKQDGWTSDDFKNLVEEDSEIVGYCQKKIGYFISYANLFSTWLEMGKDFGVSNVTDALSAFGRLINKTHKKVFDGIFKTLETGLSKLGESEGARSKAISELIQLIREIPMDGRQDYDVLGYIYEYLISMFASNAGKKAGEFFTPHEVSLLMSELVAEHLKDRDKIEIYDPTSGSGSLLINIGRSVSKRMSNKDNIKYFAQELKENTYNLTRMNLVMRGILPDNLCVRNGDTLEEDWPFFDESDPNKTYTPLYVDAVVSNPPYSQPWDPHGKESDARYKRFGLAPKSKADYAFLLHDLYHVKHDGIMTIVLPHGVLFRGGEEERIRKNLIEQNHIDAVIGLPANIFFGAGIPTIIMVLKQARTNTDVLIVDASKGFAKEGKNNKLRASDIKRIADTVAGRCDISKYSRSVSRDEIRANDYNLNIPRYVDSSEKAESWDIYATMFGGIPSVEVDVLSQYWSAFPSLRQQLFEGNATPYLIARDIDVRAVIKNNVDVQKFENSFRAKFADFDTYLKRELIENAQTVPVSMEENTIAENIFARINDIPLVDKYYAYQLLDDDWTKIAIDLEIIQTEGFDAVKKTDPKMALKKDKGSDVEIQDGWIGHVLSFEFVQEKMLGAQLSALKEQQNRLAEIISLQDEFCGSLSEDEKDDVSSILNEDKDAFVPAAVIKYAKTLQNEKNCFDEDSLESRIIALAEAIIEEKGLKKSVKTRAEDLQALTKTTIENLTDAQAQNLLVSKWIEPLCTSLFVIPQSIVSALENKINALTKKYSVTMVDVEREIEQSENALSALIDDLTGDEFDMTGLKELQKLLGGDKW